MGFIIEEARKAIELLEAEGFEAYLVGGCVRDYLMGCSPKDYDLTTSAKPEEIIRVFAAYRTIETGIRHGTITLMMNERPLEVTTYRIEKSYSDYRHPDGVEFTGNLREDLMRRDFTMNAIAYHPTKGMVDPFGGQADIQKKQIRCVGDPEARFEEDALRILRALRFAATLGFTLEEKTQEALFHKCSRLMFVSAERVTAELTKLLCGSEVKRILLSYIDILSVILPELLPMKGFQQKTRYHSYDVLHHTAVALEHTPPIPRLRWTILLHDCGKPETFTMDQRGNGHFYGHEKVSRKLAECILKRLKMDRVTSERIVTLISLHDTPIEAEIKVVKRWLAQLTPDVFFDLLEVKRADNWGQAPEYHSRQKHYDELANIASKIIEEHECLSRANLAINGRDLMELGLQGKELGKMLQVLLEAVLDEKVANEKMALLHFVEKNRSLS